jgi:hypothetical protein
MSDYRILFDERLRREVSAPIILQGSVVEVNEIGSPRRSQGDPRILVQLTRITVSVETVIKGNLPENPVEFNFFTYSGKNQISLGVPRYIPVVGQRRIYFLTHGPGGYRSIGDITIYNLPVSTGLHGPDFCQGKTPGCCIADLMLTPGQNPDYPWLAGVLIEAEYTARTLCSKSRAHALLNQLLDSPDKRVSEAARELAAALAR